MFSGGNFLESLVSGGGGGGGNTIPVPLSAFLITTPEAALQSAHDQGYTCIALDQPYTFTGGVTITVQHFQIWGFGNRITKEFNGNLFTLTNTSRWTMMRDLFISPQGGTYTGGIVNDFGGGNGFYENIDSQLTDTFFYNEAAIGAFNRGVMVGLNVSCVDTLRGAVRMYYDIDPDAVVTGNGKMFAVDSSAGTALDCGKAQELKVFGMTSRFPVISGSVKTHFSNCRLTTQLPTLDIDFPESFLLTFDNCSFGVPVYMNAPYVRIVGCRFNDLTLDCTVSLISAQVTGDLVYGPNHNGASLRPGAVARMTNLASTTWDCVDGDTHILSANQNTTITAPLNPSPGQVVRFLYTAVSANRTATFDTGTGGFDLAGTTITATTSGKTDIITCIYSRGALKWYVIGYTKGDAAPDPGPRYDSSGSFTAQTGDGVSLNISEPPTPVVGALWLGFMLSKNNEVHTWPAGWTKVAQDNSGASFTQSWAWHFADGTETGYTNVLVGGVNVVAGSISQYTGVNAVPIGNVSLGSSAVAVTTRDVGSVTTTGTNSHVVYMFMAQTGGNRTDATPAGGWVERIDSGGVVASHVTVGDLYVPVSGTPSGAIAVTGSVSAVYVARQIELMAI